MKPLRPKVPPSLHPLARAVLEGLQGHPEAEAIIIGGGVALQHYLEHRKTVDLDAWWAKGARPDTEGLIRQVMRVVGERHALLLAERPMAHSQMASYELLELEKGGKKVFSFQISPRDIELDPPLASAWSPVRIETFRDNLGAKMNALIGRGAPRDFLDVHASCQHALATPRECWHTWGEKNPHGDVALARVAVLEHLAALEGRRPLAGIAVESERTAAEALRIWVRQVFCADTKDDREPGP